MTRSQSIAPARSLVQLQRIRHERGLSRHKLGRRIRRSGTYVRLLETGYTRYPPELAITIARALEVDVAVLSADVLTLTVGAGEAFLATPHTAEALR